MSHRNAFLIFFLFLFASSPLRIDARSDEKSAVEASVREFERAVEEFDFDRQISLMIPGGKWIEEDSYPVAANYIDDWWRQAKKAKLRISNRRHDFEIHVQGDVAWVIVFVDVTTIVDNAAARELTARTHPNEQKWTGHFVETEVWNKTSNAWRIALGHVSHLPESK